MPHEALMRRMQVMELVQNWAIWAYLQTGIGYVVKTDMPGLKGEKVGALYASGARWLRGEALEWRE
jgi:hypothetical protein